MFDLKLFLQLAEICDLKIEQHDTLKELILVHHKEAVDLRNTDAEKEVIVDSECGASVLRGSHIYAPGVMAMMCGILSVQAVMLLVLMH